MAGQRHFKRIKKYVILEGIVTENCGVRFWTLADPTGGDNTWGINQEMRRVETWYREVSFTDTEAEALAISRGAGYRNRRVWKTA